MKRIAQTLLATALAAFALAAAAVEVNNANQAQLETVKGIGPGLSTRILDERTNRGAFRDWADFVARVKGVGAGAAAKFSADGLRVGGAPYPASGVQPATSAAAK